jgi:hypothetical protein
MSFSLVWEVEMRRGISYRLRRTPIETSNLVQAQRRGEKTIKVLINDLIAV